MLTKLFESKTRISVAVVTVLAVAALLGTVLARTQVSADPDPSADSVVSIDGKSREQLAAELSASAGYQVLVPSVAPGALRLNSARVERSGDQVTGKTFATHAVLEFLSGGWDGSLPPPQDWVRLRVTQWDGRVFRPEAGDVLKLPASGSEVIVQRSGPDQTEQGVVRGASYWMPVRNGADTITVEVFGGGALPTDADIQSMLESMLR